jgi:hypothetical protein
VTVSESTEAAKAVEAARTALEADAGKSGEAKGTIAALEQERRSLEVQIDSVVNQARSTMTYGRQESN